MFFLLIALLFLKYRTAHLFIWQIGATGMPERIMQAGHGCKKQQKLLCLFLVDI